MKCVKGRERERRELVRAVAYVVLEFECNFVLACMSGSTGGSACDSEWTEEFSSEDKGEGIFSGSAGSVGGASDVVGTVVAAVDRVALVGSLIVGGDVAAFSDTERLERVRVALDDAVAVVSEIFCWEFWREDRLRDGYLVSAAIPVVDMFLRQERQIWRLAIKCAVRDCCAWLAAAHASAPHTQTSYILSCCLLSPVPY